MLIKVVQIGNSRGIRLNKSILDHYQIQDYMELELKKDCVVLRAPTEIRKGWESAFSEMSANKDDILLIPDVFSDEDFEE